MKTIDITPTWVATARIYMMVLVNGNAEGRKNAEEGILEMGRVLDLINKESLLKEGAAEKFPDHFKVGVKKKKK